MRQPKSTHGLAMQREAPQAGETRQEKKEDDKFLDEKLKERGREKNNVLQTFLLISSDLKKALFTKEQRVPEIVNLRVNVKA